VKNFILAVFALASICAHAGEVTVLEAELSNYAYARAVSEARFFMDTTTGEGFVKAQVYEERFSDFPGNTWCSYDRYGNCIPHRQMPAPVQVLVYAKTQKVEGLMLMGDQAVYQGEQGNVVCGTMKPSRILKVPTLYLSGNCKLNSKIVKNGMNSKLIVTLKTK
jgi:hypothetical protein